MENSTKAITAKLKTIIANAPTSILESGAMRHFWWQSNGSVDLDHAGRSLSLSVAGERPSGTLTLSCLSFLPTHHAGTTIPPMVPHMICVLPYLNSNAQVRHLRISVPLVPGLLDGEKYFRPDDLPPPAGDELRPLSRPRLTRSAHRDAALGQDGGNVRRATAELAIERGGGPAALPQQLAYREAAGRGQRPRREAAPLAFLDQQ
jgi:hypothetical protein